MKIRTCTYCEARLNGMTGRGVIGGWACRDRDACSCRQSDQHKARMNRWIQDMKIKREVTK